MISPCVGSQSRFRFSSSFIVCCRWQFAWGGGGYGFTASSSRSRRCADLLFILRMVPFLVATGVTLVLLCHRFCCSSHGGGGVDGRGAVMLGCGGMAVMLAGALERGCGIGAGRETVARWSKEARVIDSCRCDYRQPVAVMRTSAAAPPLTAAAFCGRECGYRVRGVCADRAGSLRSALRHEVVHVPAEG